MKKEVKSDPPEDIPAWFMTYSDVITLLMTFFILLLTFSTTEKERFEKITASFSGNSGATGVAGHAHEGLDRDCWSTRVRPRAARIAMEGSEIPGEITETSEAAVGRGLETVDEEQAKKDVMKSYAFQANLPQLVNEHNQLTSRGIQIAAKLSKQLKSLPVHCAIEISNKSIAERAIAFADHLYHVEMVRPGQIGVGMVDDIDSTAVRFVIERYES
ncbi:flagellar motor protein MotB [Stieleria varia]|uniref:Flagellar motor protein MotB n=1 Tax=Stieleria varia TaxID=2528005 RepID=A0A5C6ARY5_9BACT|nr:flagellar motor protein MotB [Stieleria varia]TWU02167.1 flagellar motor protein MotB [Stieleria varia]